MEVAFFFLCPVSLDFKEWLAWRDRAATNGNDTSRLVAIGQGAPLEQLTSLSPDVAWEAATIEAFVKSRGTAGWIEAFVKSRGTAGWLVPLPQTGIALQQSVSSVHGPSVQAHAMLVASAEDGPCLLACLRVSSSPVDAQQIDPRAARAAFNAAALERSGLPWRSEVVAAGIALPPDARIAEDTTHVASFVVEPDDANASVHAVFRETHAAEEGTVVDTADTTASDDLGIRYYRVGFSYTTIAARRIGPAIFFLPSIVRAQMIWQALRNFRRIVVTEGRAQQLNDSAADGNALVFFERFRFEFELWDVELDGFTSALRPWQRVLYQTYQTYWTLERSRQVFLEGLARLIALLEAKLRRQAIRAETRQSRVLFVLAVLQVMGLAGVLATYVDLFDRGGVPAQTAMGGAAYMAAIIGFLALTSIMSLALALAAETPCGSKDPLPKQSLIRRDELNSFLHVRKADSISAC